MSEIVSNTSEKKNTRTYSYLLQPSDKMVIEVLLGKFYTCPLFWTRFVKKWKLNVLLILKFILNKPQNICPKQILLLYFTSKLRGKPNQTKPNRKGRRRISELEKSKLLYVLCVVFYTPLVINVKFQHLLFVQ